MFFNIALKYSVFNAVSNIQDHKKLPTDFDAGSEYSFFTILLRILIRIDSVSHDQKINFSALNWLMKLLMLTQFMHHFAQGDDPCFDLIDRLEAK